MLQGERAGLSRLLSEWTFYFLEIFQPCTPNISEVSRVCNSYEQIIISIRGNMRRIIVLIAILGWASSVYSQEPPPAKVVLGEVVREEVAATYSVTGVLYYERISDISAEVAGLVDEVGVSQGDRVNTGAPLVKLNTEILEKDIALARTRIEQIELRIKNTEKNYKRLEKLYTSSGVSEKDFEDASYSYKDAQKEKQALEDNLAKLFIQMKRSEIKTPFDGIVLSKNVDIGAWVQQGKSLVSLGSINDLYVRVPVAEDLLRYISEGEQVQVTITAYNTELQGVVEGIDPVADLKTKNVFVKVKIEPPAEFLAQNMSASVLLPRSVKQELSVFSRAALIKFQGKDFVYAVKEGKASILPVHIVAYLGKRVAVDNPYIVPGLPLIVEGNERLRPDQPVVAAGEN
jgi:membrane fusion protein (multidrug efflux system)